MNYKYLNSISKISPNTKEVMLKEYQSYMDEQFYNSTDWLTIQRETEEGIFENIDVRINTVYGDTGTKLSDDYRKIIFPNKQIASGLGTKYLFDSSYWLTVNYDIFAKPTASVVVHKCRNVLKWISSLNGATYTEPCVFKTYEETSAQPLYNDNITLVHGQSILIVQNNDRTKTLEYNQRFYLNHYCYKITGITSTLNNPTEGTNPLLYIVVTKDLVNEDIDDVVNNIANINEYSYSVIINQETLNVSVNYTQTLGASVLLNNTVVNREIVWSSSNPDVVSITSAGLITALTNGSATITATLSGNTNVKDTLSVNVSASPVSTYYISVNPDSRYILQGSEVTYGVYAIVNNIESSNSFTMSVSGVPTEYYDTEVVDDNHFKIINNKRYTTSPLTVVFTDTITNETKEIQVILKGVF